MGFVKAVTKTPPVIDLSVHDCIERATTKRKRKRKEKRKA